MIWQGQGVTPVVESEIHLYLFISIPHDMLSGRVANDICDALIWRNLKQENTVAVLSFKNTEILKH